MKENEKELKSLLMKVEEESEKAGLKLKFKALRSWPIRPKGNQSWIFIGSTDAEAETPILWPPHVKNWLIGKDPDAGKGWRQEEKGMTEDEMIGWHCRLSGHEFEQALGVGNGQEAWLTAVHGVAESDMTEWLNWTELNWRSWHSVLSLHGNYVGKKWKLTDFIFLDSKIIADGDCSYEIKRHLLLGRKAMTNLDSILKSRDITLPTKVHIVKAVACPVVM